MLLSILGVCIALGPNKTIREWGMLSPGGASPARLLIPVPRLGAGPPAAKGSIGTAQTARPSRVPWPEGVARHGCALCAAAATEPDPRTGRRLCSLCSLADGLLLGNVGGGGLGGSPAGLGESPASVNQLSPPTTGDALLTSPVKQAPQQQPGTGGAPARLAGGVGQNRLATNSMPTLLAVTPPPGLMPPSGQGHGSDGGIVTFPWMLGGATAQLAPLGQLQGAAPVGTEVLF